MEPAQVIEEPSHHEIALSLDRMSEVARLRAELGKVREALTRRESELLDLKSRLGEIESLKAEKLDSLSVLAGGVAHEFNNLLMSILGYADLARSALPPLDPAERSIENISRSARRAADLAHQMLAFSGKGTFVVSPLDLSRLVASMQAQIEAVLPARATLRLDLDSGLQPLDADASQLELAVMSLITNASEALLCESGSITLSTGQLVGLHAELSKLYLPQSLAEGPYVFLDVIDDGCGMDAATAARIFEPFFSTKFIGRGLGLAATWGIVRGHLGGIRVDSALGEGTRLRLIFPVTGPDVGG